jgi:hypothetical protein
MLPALACADGELAELVISWNRTILEQKLGERISRAIIAAPLAHEEFLSLDDGWHH